ncbi:hypothetical protein B0H16DRAFT_1479028 [Mycena metata]|uniref:Mug135-like C-terminal domain-containing protein n=1 Tax=Mycena metata TaxID=1033252 RepID=A0AAD7H657_9AGAR|nr:hypothetical protein B0H16DRAFT_1479028 [Mycena metata]
MPPVPLPVPTPNFPFSNIANVVPHTPNDPPSVADVIAAKNYAQRALTAGKRPYVFSTPFSISRQPNTLSRSTIGPLLALSFMRIPFWVPHLAVYSAAAPPWFADALNLGLNPINTRLDAIEDRLHEIDTRLDNIVTKIDQLTIFASQNHNRTLGDGRPVAFKPVAFPDGSLPSENDNTPTALTNLAVLDNLSYEELRAYCEAYYPGRAYGNGQRLLERKKSIREAIGCTAEY